MKKPEYLQIPMTIIQDDDIRRVDQLIYGAIYYFGRLKEERCTASNKTLAEMVGCSISAVRHSLTRLEKKKYIRREYNDSSKKKRKEIMPLVYLQTAQYGVGTNEPGDGTYVPGGVGTNEPQNKNSTLSKNNIKKEKNKKRKKEIEEVSSHYQQKIKSNSRLTKKARKKIKTRLKEFKVEELKTAIDNFSEDDWWMDNNSHRGMSWFFHSEDRIDQFINLEPRNNKKDVINL